MTDSPLTYSKLYCLMLTFKLSVDRLAFHVSGERTLPLQFILTLSISCDDSLWKPLCEQNHWSPLILTSTDIIKTPIKEIEEEPPTPQKTGFFSKLKNSMKPKIINNPHTKRHYKTKHPIKDLIPRALSRFVWKQTYVTCIRAKQILKNDIPSRDILLLGISLVFPRQYNRLFVRR